jgi:hypothetical protein
VEQRHSGVAASSGPPGAVAAVRAARAGRGVAGGVAVRADGGVEEAGGERGG